MTTNFSLTTRAAAAVILMVLAAGCAKSADSSATQSTPGSTSADSTSTDSSVSSDNSAGGGASPSEADSTPAQEGSGAEPPQKAKKGGPSISGASLPIGGSAEGDGAHQCGRVSLLLQELPPGISISVSSITLEPPGIFTLDGDPCGSEPPCSTWAWTTETTDKACTVAATQVIDSADSATLKVLGTVSCPDDSSCDQVRSKLGGSQFQFTASTGVVPSGASSSSGAGTDGSSEPGSTSSSSSPAVSASAEPSTSTEASTTGS